MTIIRTIIAVPNEEIRIHKWPLPPLHHYTRHTLHRGLTTAFVLTLELYLQISWSLTNDLNLLLVLFHRKCCTFNNGCPKLSLLPFSSKEISEKTYDSVALFLISDILMEMIERRSRGQIRYQISFCIAPAAKHIISTMRDETWLRQEMLRTSRSGEKHGNCSNGKTLTRGFLSGNFNVLFSPFWNL